MSVVKTKLHPSCSIIIFLNQSIKHWNHLKFGGISMLLFVGKLFSNGSSQHNVKNTCEFSYIRHLWDENCWTKHVAGIPSTLRGILHRFKLHEGKSYCQATMIHKVPREVETDLICQTTSSSPSFCCWSIGMAPCNLLIYPLRGWIPGYFSYSTCTSCG